MASLVVLAGLAVCLMGAGLVAMGASAAVALLTMAVVAGSLFRWPRLLLGWCAGAFVLGPLALGIAALMIVPLMTGGFGDIGLGFMIYALGFCGFLGGPVAGIFLGRLWQKKASRGWGAPGATTVLPTAARPTWLRAAAWSAGGLYVAWLLWFLVRHLVSSETVISAKLVMPMALGAVTILLTFWPRLQLGWAVGGVLLGAVGLAVLRMRPDLGQALPHYDLYAILGDMGVRWIGFAVGSLAGLAAGSIWHLAAPAGRRRKPSWTAGCG
jgi:hypothetical protein